ncbi:hybrid sensor histidine kinase/response regulator [Geothermobacter hydrogeniphilus]|uniref:histidine kinase n=2 Tax=Geothermobacter hydrogeniphilus TaxID=1969733 RepID=A0A1X0Y363_9BACT|nr:hybrid sensor histidine kinase/response regulator [Geothermobacter hydrogeniphilus]
MGRVDSEMKDCIVVVDDERIILELTSMILTSRGYEVHTAEDGVAGVELVRRHQPSVVLLDYMMPKMDGLTALKLIREEYPSSYVVMFTGKGSEEIAVELMKAGASDYILKPFSNHDLIDRIEQVLRLRRIELNNLELRRERERLLREVEEWNLELEHRVEEKSRELERAHAEILQAEKLAALGHVSAGMAHEIRNPLNSISLFAQVLRGAVQNDSELVTYADKIINEVDRIDELLVKLLATSNQPLGPRSEVNLPDLIRSVLESFSDQLRAQKIELDVALVPAEPFMADPEEVKQIFSNLIANALHEMPDGGRLKIHLGRADQVLQIEVSDTGAGIPEEHLSQIFDPFFTTKSKGTGFGLSVVLRIVKTLGGRIRVENAVDAGARFLIELPVA